MRSASSSSGQAGYGRLQQARDLTDLPATLGQTEPALVILTINTPGNHGLDPLRALRSQTTLQHIPVLVLTDPDERQVRRRAVELGATDLLIRPIEDHELRLRVDNMLLLKAHRDHLAQVTGLIEQQVQSRTRELRQAKERLERVNERLEYEIQVRHRTAAQLRHSAFHDVLTDLPNRALLMERIERSIERSKRHPQHRFAVLFLDLDDFKLVNDSLGHRMGDQMLVAVSQRLTACLRTLDTAARPMDDTTARLGGDEFVVLLDGIGGVDDAKVVAERMQQSLSRPIELGGHDVIISTSIGIAVNDLEYDDPADILRDADTALYESKQDRKGNYRVFTAAMRARVLDRMDLEQDLRQAVKSQQVHLVYQPIISLWTGRIDSFETLLRWNHPERGAIDPPLFITIAEESGLATELGRLVLQEACRQLHQWRHSCPAEAEDLAVTVNLSAKQFNDPDLAEQVGALLDQCELEPRHLHLEITEGAIMENTDKATAILNDYRRRRIGVHMDDFGTGYSSLSYLHHLPIDAIKIDRSFVNQMSLDGKHAATVHAIQTLAHNRDMKLIAEGVETFE